MSVRHPKRNVFGMKRSVTIASEKTASEFAADATSNTPVITSSATMMSKAVVELVKESPSGSHAPPIKYVFERQSLQVQQQEQHQEQVSHRNRSNSEFNYSLNKLILCFFI